MITNIRERQYGGYAWDGGFYAGAWQAQIVPYTPVGTPRALYLMPGQISIMMGADGLVEQFLCSCPCGCGKLVSGRTMLVPVTGFQGQLTHHGPVKGCVFSFNFTAGLARKV